MTEAAKQAEAEATFLKFIGPMATLTQGRNKFIKNHIYKVFDRERALDMIDTGRFQQTRDPARLAEKAAPRRGVRIHRREEKPADASERGDMSQEDLTRGGASDGRDVAEAIKEARTPEDDHPRLPATEFLSKKDAVEWAEKNLGVKLDRSRSITELNRRVVEEYGKKFGAKAGAEDLDDEDDTREENTTVGAVVVV